MWGVACLRPNEARRATENLERQGLGVYAPRCRPIRASKTLALFPGYIFVESEEEVRLRSVRSTRGVLDFLGLVPDSIVVSLRLREGPDGVIALEPPFRDGDPVLVERGVFGGCLGVYDGQSGSERCFVLLSMLGRIVRAQVREGDLAAA